MTQRTRYFLTGSSLIVVIGLMTGMVAYYNGALAMRASGPSELSYVPENVTAVAFADVRSVMNSEFSQRIREMMPTGEAKAELQEEIGLDIENDIDTVVAGFVGNDPSKPGGIVLLRGRFDDDLIETMAVSHGATASEYGGKRMLTSPRLPYGSGSGDGDGDDTTATTAGALAFLEPGLLALGDIDTVQRAIDADGSGGSVTDSADLMAYISEVEIGNSAWFVSRADAMVETAEMAGLPETLRANVASVKWLIASANVNGGVNGTVRAEARDETSAEQMREVIRGGLAAGRLLGGEDERLVMLLNSIQLTGSGTTVALSVSVTPEILELINGIASLDQTSSGGSLGIRK